MFWESQRGHLCIRRELQDRGHSQALDCEQVLYLPISRGFDTIHVTMALFAKSPSQAVPPSRYLATL